LIETVYELRKQGIEINAKSVELVDFNAKLNKKVAKKSC
jgi:hypothetical protein